MKKIIYSKNLLGEEAIGATNGVLAIKVASSGVVDDLVKKHHYSHKSTKNRFLSFLVNGDMGFLQLGYGIRPASKQSISELISRDNYCEFDRMWLSDELPKNSESQVISLLLFYLKEVHPRIKFVITYADESAGNVGTIYKASNAISVGSVPVDFYVLESGERVHPVSMYHRHGTRAKKTLEAIYPNIKHIKGGYRQNRFLYILSKSMRSKFQERNAEIPSRREWGSSTTSLINI